jgi:hypothetical protein
MQAITQISVIPLFRAVLCLDCNCVTDANHECPACSSRALMNLSAVLDRRCISSLLDIHYQHPLSTALEKL